MNSSPIDTSSVIQRLIERVTDECKSIDVETSYCEMLDECYSFESIGGPFSGMSASRVLAECDPIAYRCGLSDYSDDQEWVEVEGNYYQQDDVEEVRDALVTELEEKETELETSIEESLENENGGDEGLVAELAQVRAEIKAVQRHSF